MVSVARRRDRERVRKRRTIRALSVMCLTAVVVAGCGGADRESTSTSGASTTGGDGSKTYRVALFAPMANAPAKAEIEGMEEAAEGENVEFTRFDSNFDPQREYKQMQDAITTGGFDAFVIQSVGGPTLIPLVEQAIQKDIKVAATNLALGPSEATFKPQVPGMTVAVVDPWSLRGEWMAQLMNEACEGNTDCKVGYVAGIATSPFESQFLKSMREELKKYPNVEIAEFLDGGRYLREEGRKVCQTMLQKTRDLDVIASTADQAAQGCEIAIRAAGLEVGLGEGQIRLLGGASSKYGIDAIRDGRWFGEWRWTPRDEGKTAMEYILRALKGEDVRDVGISTVLEGEKDGVSPLVTKETVGDFEGQWSG